MMVSENLFLLEQILFPEILYRLGTVCLLSCWLLCGSLLSSGPLQCCGPPDGLSTFSPGEEAGGPAPFCRFYPLSHHNVITQTAKTQADFFTGELVYFQKETMAQEGQRLKLK